MFLFIAVLLCTINAILCEHHHSVRRTLFSGTFSIETFAPTVSPTVAPTITPTFAPTFAPTIAPTVAPSSTTPTIAPTAAPTVRPTVTPGSPTLAPTATPTTAAPSFAPTRSPTEATVATVMSFAAKQTLTGCNAATFAASPTAQLTFRQTVADSTVSITADDVVITDISDPAARRLRSLLAVGDDAIVNYNISLAVTGGSGYSSASDAYTAISSALVTSVNSGSFTTALVTNSAASTDNIFAATTANTITEYSFVTETVDTPVPTVAPTYAPTYKSKYRTSKALDANVTLGAIIGTLLGILVLVIVAMYVMKPVPEDLKSEIAQEGQKQQAAVVFQEKDDRL